MCHFFTYFELWIDLNVDADYECDGNVIYTVKLPSAVMLARAEDEGQAFLVGQQGSWYLFLWVMGFSSSIIDIEISA